MKTIERIAKFHKEILVLLILSFAWNYAVYFGARWITGTWHHTDMTSVWDRMIPFVPWTVLLYVGWYIFWGVNYGVCAAQEEKDRNRFFCADVLSKAICLFIFLIIPTTNIRPDVAHSDTLGWLMRLVYHLDDPDNLFPSIHCVVSWLCWIGVRGRKDIPNGYKIFSLLAALAICISTLTTKQHVLVDVISGLVLAELCYLIAGISQVNALFSKSMSLLFRTLRIKRHAE